MVKCFFLENTIFFVKKEHWGGKKSNKSEFEYSV